MKADELWKLFAETGDPACYLLYKAMNADEDLPQGGSSMCRQTSTPVIPSQCRNTGVGIRSPAGCLI